MPLPAVVESLDKLPEAIRSEYEQRDGKYVLRVEGELPGFVPKGRHDEFRENNLKLTRELEEARKAVERYTGIDPEKARDALTRLQQIEEKKLIDAGQIDELVAKKTERLVSERDSRIAELTRGFDQQKNRAADLEAELSRHIVGQSITEPALTKHKIQPAALGMVAKLAELGDPNGVRWALDDQRRPVAVTADGQKVFSRKDQTQPLGIDEWLEGVIAAFPAIVPPSTGGGARGATAGGGPTADLSALPPVERLKALRRAAA